MLSWGLGGQIWVLGFGLVVLVVALPSWSAFSAGFLCVVAGFDVLKMVRVTAALLVLGVLVWPDLGCGLV
ncbi:hypothetical protein A2U01_0082177, partial [Trifolium medium]|nr:hypothetical protein [Trifolium medium]